MPKFALESERSPDSEAANHMVDELADRLCSTATEWEYRSVDGEEADITLRVTANSFSRGDNPWRCNEFWVDCHAVFDDDGTYQEPPLFRYEIQRSNAAGAIDGTEQREQRVEGVLRHFVTFLRGQLPDSDSERELILIGQDSGRPLKVRVHALSKIRRDDVDPWPPGLLGAYIAILRDASLPALDRLIETDGVWDYDQHLQPDRRRLLLEVSELPDLPPTIELKLATAVGGTAALHRLTRLLDHGDPSVVAAARKRLGWLARSEREPLALRHAALSAQEVRGRSSHVFISYVHDDGAIVDRLCRDLMSNGVEVWRDQEQLQPGQRWKREISAAIQQGDAFVAVFSTRSENRSRSYMRQELLEAVEELRLRPADRSWFFPVLLDECELPNIKIGAGESLRDLQYADMSTGWDEGIEALASALKIALTTEW